VSKRTIAAACLAALGLTALPATAQLCGQACSGTGILQFDAPDEFGFPRSRSMPAPPNLLQVDKEAASNLLNEGIRVRMNSPQEGGTGESYSIFFGLPNNAPATPGTYNATRYPFHPAAEAGFSFGGDGHGCNQSTSIFTIHEVVLGTGTAVQSLALDFSHQCENNGPSTTGQVRFNSSFPIGGGGGPGPGGPGGPRVSNLSTRGLVMTGDDVMINGFVIGGTTNKTVAIVATGPSLAAYGIANPLLNPTITLTRQSDSAVMATNDDWTNAPNQLALQWSGYAPPHSQESAILISLAPGAYTVILSGTGGTSGVGVMAVYEAAQPDTPLVNLSTRGLVGLGNDVMISGFVIPPSGSKTVAVVATGPSLSAFGFTNSLANPTLTIVRSADQTVVATNDDWGTDANAAQLQAAGLAPSDPLEAAIMVSLPPGAYTAIVSGAGGGTGLALIGVYAP
jgi:hypothetical protein